MAQNSPAAPFERVPMMDASVLDDRTKPLTKSPTPIWLRHLLQEAHARRSSSAAERAREWLRQRGVSDRS